MNFWSGIIIVFMLSTKGPEWRRKSALIAVARSAEGAPKPGFLEPVD